MMKRLALLATVAAALLSPGDATLAVRDDGANESQFPNSLTGHNPKAGLLVDRSSDTAPSGYVPGKAKCPDSKPKIRNGSSISPEEKKWLPLRRNETITHIRSFLKRVAIRDFDSEEYLADAEANSTALPNIGIAISGGGYRALLGGAGALASWDSRSTGSDGTGNVGGLLQSATYISGVSSGAWLVGSLSINNFSSVQDSIDAPGIWQFENSIFTGPDQYSLRQYYTDLFGQVEAKEKAAWSIAISDYLGRMLAYQLVNATDGGPGYTFSSIANDTAFEAGKVPLPFLLSSERIGEKSISLTNTTVFEFTPWELGSSDPSLAGWVPLKYIGTKFDDGQVPEDERCVQGLDNVGFVMGTSSTIFNNNVLSLCDKSNRYVPDGLPNFVPKKLESVRASQDDTTMDVAYWSPNPFYGFNPSSNLNYNHTQLALVDGSEDLQNIPYHPHLHPERKVDTVFSFDSSSDTETGWPDGAAIIASYERSLQSIGNLSPFPPVPDKNTFVNHGLNTRPVFFGCNASNFSSTTDRLPPLVVYLPNYPYVYNSNVSTFQMAIKEGERSALVDNGWAVATQLNSTQDTEWPACVGCAILARSFYRTNTSLPEQCKHCFERYCWNGTTNTTAPNSYYPTYVGEPINVKDSGGATSARAGVSVLLAAVVAVCVMAVV